MRRIVAISTLAAVGLWGLPLKASADPQSGQALSNSSIRYYSTPITDETPQDEVPSDAAPPPSIAPLGYVASPTVAPRTESPESPYPVETTPKFASTQQAVQYYQEFQGLALGPSLLPKEAPPTVVLPLETATGPRALSYRRTSTPTPTPTLEADPKDPVVMVSEVEVSGAVGSLEETLRQMVETQPGGQTNQRQLQSDVQTLLETGLFRDVRYTTRETPNGLVVLFRVDPVIVQSLQLVGAEALPQREAEQRLRFKPGTAVNPFHLQQGAAQINQWYKDNGYVLAKVVAIRPSREGIIFIEVFEGEIGSVNLRFLDRDGNPVNAEGEAIEGRTKESFIRQQLKIQPGQVFQEQVLQSDLKTLVQLGIFDNVTVSIAGETNGKIDLVYDLQEAKSRSFNIGGGVDNRNGLAASVSYRDQNVGGTAQKLSANVTLGLRDVQFDTVYTNPYRDSTPDRLGYSFQAARTRQYSSVFDEPVDLPNGDTAREDRFGGGASVMKGLGDDWMGTLGLNYTRVSIRDSDGKVFSEDEEGNPLTLSGTGIDDLFYVSLAVSQDHRDNPRVPTKGSQITLSMDQSIPIGLGEVFGNRLRANYSFYTPVSWFSDAKRPEVLAFNIQGGTVIGDLPPYDAFVLGGIDTVRGYDFGDLASGRSYFLASAEYRFPLYKFIGGVMFADFGTDLGTGDTVLGEPAIVRDKPGTGMGMGLGLRVASPVGLIRADYGINDQGESRLHFGLGERF